MNYFLIEIYRFSARGAGSRQPDGEYLLLKENVRYWAVDEMADTPESAFILNLYQISEITIEPKATGFSVRVIKDDAVKTDYTGNDGRVYHTIKIGDQV